MMPLVGDITLREIQNEQDRFDFLSGVRDLVTKCMEFHADDEQDSEYCFLFWVEHEMDFVARVQSNIQELGEDDHYGWNFDMNWNGTGLVFVRTFL